MEPEKAREETRWGGEDSVRAEKAPAAWALLSESGVKMLCSEDAGLP